MTVEFRVALHSDMNNSTRGMTMMEQEWGEAAVLVLAVLLIIFMVIAAIGNLLVLLSILTVRKIIKSRSYMFIFNLALGDFLTAICVMPISLVTLLNGDFIYSHEVCEFNGFTVEIFFIANIHCLMYMAVYRYMSISHPLNGKVAKWKVMLMIGASWLWALIISIASWRLLNHFLYKPYTTQCGPDYPTEIKGWANQITVAVTCFIVPVIVIIVMYVMVFVKARHHFKRMTDHSNLALEVHKQKQELTKTFIIIVIGFLVCWSPLFGYLNYVSYVHDKDSIPTLLNPIVYWFGFMNSALNPIIFGFRTPIFKAFWCRLIRKKDMTTRPNTGGSKPTSETFINHRLGYRDVRPSLEALHQIPPITDSNTDFDDSQA